jgi:hypothetical protein
MVPSTATLEDELEEDEEEALLLLDESELDTSPHPAKVMATRTANVRPSLLLINSSFMVVGY